MVKPRKDDLVAIVEQAYTLEGDTDAWLARIIASAGALDDGLGVIAYRIRTDFQTIDAFASTHPGTYDRRAVISVAGMLPPEDREILFPTRAVTTLSERLHRPVRAHPLYELLFKPTGMEDALAVVAPDRADGVIVLSVPLRRPTKLSARERARLDRIAIHVGTANRLRERWQAERSHQVDAVLSPDGTMVHARGDASRARAREQLRERVLDIERARTSARSDDELHALCLWQGLVDGTWSLFDHFDSDGRRFLVARENGPLVPARAALTLREAQMLELFGQGQSQKLIAYELGLSQSAVSAGLRTVAYKLGVASVPELSAVARDLSNLRAKALSPQK